MIIEYHATIQGAGVKDTASVEVIAANHLKEYRKNREAMMKAYELGRALQRRREEELAQLRDLLGGRRRK